MAKITLEIDVDKDFDAGDVLLGTKDFNTAKRVLTKLYNIWCDTINEPNWKIIMENNKP